MRRQNAEMLGLQVLQAKAASRSGSIEGSNIQGEVFRSQSDRSGLLETTVADTGCSYCQAQPQLNSISTQTKAVPMIYQRLKYFLG